jgi:hypothetical protein
MKGKNLVVILVVAAALIVLAVLTSREKPTQAASVVGRKVFPDLAINDVERLVAVSAGATVTVAKAESGWVLPGKFGYPADFKKVRDAILKLQDLKIGQLARLNDAMRAKLKMKPVGDKDGGTRLDLLGKQGRAIASLLIGATHERASEESAGPTRYGGYPDGRYISPDAGATVYLVTDTLNELVGEPKEWLDTEIVSVNAADIREIAVTGEGRAELRLTKKDGDSKFELANVPEGKELDTSKTYSIESALSYLRFNEIADPASTNTAAGMAKPVTFQAETKKGEIYTARIGQSPAGGSDRYLRMEVGLKPAPPAADKKDDEAAKMQDEERKKQDEERKKQEKERRELEEKVAALNKKFQGWTYLISSYSAESLTKTHDSLLKEKEKPKPATNAVPAAASAPTASTNAPAPAAAAPAATNAAAATN